MRLVLLNQFYPPDLSPTAHLCASLAEHRAAQGDEVTVITSRAGYLGRIEHRAAHHGVRVLRVWSTQLGSRSRLRRAIDWLTFYMSAFVRTLRLPCQDVIISMTTPPYIAWAGVVHKLLHPGTRLILWNMDCYPEAVERTGMLRTGAPLSQLMRAMNRAIFRRLDHLVCLDGAMADLLSQYLPHSWAAPCSIIPNWERASLFPAGEGSGFGVQGTGKEGRENGAQSDTGVPPAPSAAETEKPRSTEASYLEHGRDARVTLEGPSPDVGSASADGPVARSSGSASAKADPTQTQIDSTQSSVLSPQSSSPSLTLLYLGNAGYGHDFDTLLAAAEILREDPVRFLFIGGGAKRPLLERESRLRGLNNIILKDYVPKEQTPAVMRSAHAALITLEDPMLGVMSPSKLHSNLAMGLPVIYVGPRGSNVDEAIARFGCGISLRVGQADEFAQFVRKLIADPQEHAALRALARRAFDQAYCDRVTLRKFDAILEQMIHRRDAGDAENAERPFPDCAVFPLPRTRKRGLG